MTKLKVHYDGWLALPSGLCQKLGVKTGDRLEAELVDGGVLLRAAAKARRPAAGDAAESRAAAAEPAAAGDAEPAVRRKPGRPRKSSGGTGEPAAAPAVRKTRGRPRAAAGAEPDPVPRPVVGIGPAKLVKKADLPAAPAAPAPEPAPREPLTQRGRGDDHASAVERRPFRQVEVRKLGPGHGHNRPRRAAGRATQAG